MSFFRSRSLKQDSEQKPSSFIPKPGERFLDGLASSNHAQSNSDTKDSEESLDHKNTFDQKDQEETVDNKMASDEKDQEETVDHKIALDEKDQEETVDHKTTSDEKDQEESMDFKSVSDGKDSLASAAVGATTGAVGGILGAESSAAVGAATGASAASNVPPTVTFGDVDSPTTPSTMAQKRLPPRVVNNVTYSVANGSVGMKDIKISVQNGNAANGNATLNGRAKVKTKATGVLNVKGTRQTKPGNGGKIRLVAKYGGVVVGASNFFSISAIPENWNSTFVSLITGAKRGFVVQDGWKSDSGVFADLDNTEISEQVQYHSGSGVFKGVSKGENSDYLPGNKLTKDSHGIGAAALTSAGTLLTNQTCIFKDKRSGANDIPMKNTGYKLSRVVKETAPKSGKFEITTTKNGGATKANGYSSNAGAGAKVSKTQAI